MVNIYVTEQFKNGAGLFICSFMNFMNFAIKVAIKDEVICEQFTNIRELLLNNFLSRYELRKLEKFLNFAYFISPFYRAA